MALFQHLYQRNGKYNKVKRNTQIIYEKREPQNGGFPL